MATHAIDSMGTDSPSTNEAGASHDWMKFGR